MSNIWLKGYNTTEPEMSKFTYTVAVHAENKEQADQVIRERINHDDDYGFDYRVEMMKISDLVNLREQIQEDIITCCCACDHNLEGSELIDNLCQIVVDRINGEIKDE